MPEVEERNGILRDSALFSVLTRPELEYAAEHSSIRRFRRGQAIVQRNKVSTGMHSVVEGFAKFGMQSADGGEVIFSILGAGDWFGEMAVIDGKLEPGSAIAIGPAMVITVQRSAVLKLVEGNKRLGLALSGLLATRARAQYRRIEEIQLYDLSTRLARTLIMLAKQHHRAARDGEALGIALPLTQSDLAAMLGATRVRVNLLLGMYRDTGVIRLDRTGIVILLPEQLREHARIT